MPNLCKKSLFIIIVICATSVYAQPDITSRIQIARDSLTNNPNYSYAVLSKLYKQKPLTHSDRVHIQLNLARYFNVTGIADSTIYYVNKALPFIKTQKQFARAYQLLGSGNRGLGKREAAFKWLMKSLKTAEKINNKEMLCSAKSELGILYGVKGDLDKALVYLKESLEAAPSSEGSYKIYMNIGKIYLSKGNLKLAETYFGKGLEDFSIHKDPSIVTIALLNLGRIAFEKDEYEQAKKYFTKGREIAAQYHFKTYRLNAIRNLGLVQDAQGDHQAAILTLNQALIEAKRLYDLDNQKDIYKDLSFVHAKVRDYKTANAYQKEYYKLQDSLNKDRFAKEIKELEIQYETEKRKKEVEVLKVTSKNQKLELKNQQDEYKALILEKELESEQDKNRILLLENASQREKNKNLELREEQNKKENEIKRQKVVKSSLLIGSLVVLIPIIILLITYYQKLKTQIALNKSQEEVNGQKISSLIKDQELKLIKTSVEVQDEERQRIAQELHDSIGGNLASIKMQLSAFKEQSTNYTRVVKQLDETYDQVRDISHTLIPKKFQQNAFTTLVKEYIENIKNSNGFDISFHPHPEEHINLIEETILVTIFKVIQELLNNALKYSKANRIEIHLNKHPDDIKLLFEDDGVGFDVHKTTKGIGLRNIKNRLDSLSGSLVVDSYPQRGTIIDIDIPLFNDKPSNDDQ